MALTSPATPGLSADGHLRCPKTASEPASSTSDRMRKLLRAGGGVGAGHMGGTGFQPNWSILRLKERMADIERIRLAEKEAREAGLWHPGPPLPGGIGGIGDMQPQQGPSGAGMPAEEQAPPPPPPKKKKKKRAADDGDKDTAAASAPSAKKKKGKANESPDKPMGAVKPKVEEGEEVKPPPKKKPKKKAVKTET